MQTTNHTRVLYRTIRSFANTCHKSMTEYYQLPTDFKTFSNLQSRLSYNRSFDELKLFIEYNAKALIEENSLISPETLKAFMTHLTNKYLDDKCYQDLKEGVATSYNLTEMSDSFSKDSFTVSSIKEVLQSHELLDYQNKDELKRIIFKENIFHDKQFLKLVDKYTNPEMSYNSAEDMLEYFYAIIENCVYPNYYFLDANDIRDIIMQLTFERSHNTGFFSKRNFTIVKGRYNKKRSFSLINDYEDNSYIIDLGGDDVNFSQIRKNIFCDVDLSDYMDNHGESVLDFQKELDLHLAEYDKLYGYKMRKLNLSHLLSKKVQ